MSMVHPEKKPKYKIYIVFINKLLIYKYIVIVLSVSLIFLNSRKEIVLSTLSKLGLTSACSSTKLVALKRVSSMMSFSCSSLSIVIWGRRRAESKLARISWVSSEGLNWFFKAKAFTSSFGNGDKILCKDWKI